MNPQLNKVFSKLAKADKLTELASEKVELANVKDVEKAITAYKEAEQQLAVSQSFYKKSKKAFDEFENTWTEYSVKKGFAEDAIKKGKSFDKEINELEKTAKDLGIDVKQIKGYSELLKLKSEVDKEFKKISKFKYPAK
jgi:hypothetical protein